MTKENDLRLYGREKEKMKNRFEKMAENGIAFRSPNFKKVGLVGKNSRIYNSVELRDVIDILLDSCKLDIDVIDEGFGKCNILIKRYAKKENGRYNEKDVICRFYDCLKMWAFISGYSVGKNS